MNCQDWMKKANAYIDDELDPISSLKFEEHLQQCGICSADLSNQKEFLKVIKASDLSFAPSKSFEKKLLDQIRKQDDRSSSVWDWTKFSKAAGYIVVCLSVLMTYSWIQSFRGNDSEVDEIISAHIRSTMAEHLVDVRSSDKHTVKPWFTGKLDFSPPVSDFAEKDFQLIGGRLEYLNHRPVAALIYQHRRHMINLFIENSSKAADQSIRKSGYGVIRWTQGDFSFALVSDLNQEELQELANLLK